MQPDHEREDTNPERRPNHRAIAEQALPGKGRDHSEKMPNAGRISMSDFGGGPAPRKRAYPVHQPPARRREPGWRHGRRWRAASSPLLQGASGRLWVAKDGRVRLELQVGQGRHGGRARQPHADDLRRSAEHRLPLRAPAARNGGERGTASVHYGGHVPSVAEIEEALARLERHVNIAGATPANVAGQPAYTARVSPKEGGSLLGGAEVSWDAAHGAPLRAAIYSSHSASPVIELTATEISYGAVESSVFELTPPEGAKIVEPHHGMHEPGPRRRARRRRARETHTLIPTCMRSATASPRCSRSKRRHPGAKAPNRAFRGPRR